MNHLSNRQGQARDNIASGFVTHGDFRQMSKRSPYKLNAGVAEDRNCPRCNLIMTDNQCGTCAPRIYGRDEFQVPEQLGLAPHLDQGFNKDTRELKRMRLAMGANNVYFNDGCPALMEDGRFLTNWRSSSEVTNEMGIFNNLQNSNEVRAFLQNNGLNLMREQRAYLAQTNSCTPGTACSEGYYDLWNNRKGSWTGM